MVATSYGNEGLIVIGDPSLVLMDDSITGANIDGFHAIHASYPRDFTVTAIADIAHATDGNLSDTDGTALRETRADIVITCGPAISEAGSYLTEEGHSLPITALPFTINLTSWIEQIVEKHHDEAGILWPTLIAPFDIYLLTLAREDNTRIAGETLYRQLTGAGWRVLYDPRSLSPGAKFADADLIGCPVRIVVSDKSLMEDSVEIKLRQEKERQIILLKDLEEVLKTLIP
jgi:prolyl-tRNA synthetase